MQPAPTMPWWHPDALARRRPYLAARARIAQAARQYFIAEGFTEVETPSLQIAPGAEPHMQPFATQIDQPFGDGPPQPAYLHGSPEFAMRKLVAAGAPQIFQLARVFRNAERGVLHHPEFTMLEWYRPGADTGVLMADCEALIGRALAAANIGALSHDGRDCRAAAPFARLSVTDAFARHAGIDLLPLIGDRDALAEAARGIGIAPAPGDDWEDVYFRIFLDRIEPHLGWDGPVFLTGFPAPLAALGRDDPADNRLSTRFELYALGIELANGWVEITDPAVLTARLHAARDKRRRLYGEELPIDQDFIRAAAAGGDCVGIALGFDRLVMLASGAPDVASVLWAPVAAP